VPRSEIFKVIPDYAKMRWYVRAPTRAEVEALRERVKACFEYVPPLESLNYTFANVISAPRAAAIATSCKFEIKTGLPLYDLRQNAPLGSSDNFYFGYIALSHSQEAHEFAAVIKRYPGWSVDENSTAIGGSTVSCGQSVSIHCELTLRFPN
jgi:metal-dependent amidase/aminoacylase/carboxypeptidase family protein